MPERKVDSMAASRPAATSTVAHLLRRVGAMGIDVALILGWAAVLGGLATFLRTTEVQLGPSAWDLVALLTLVGPVTVLFAVQEASPAHATFGKRRLQLRIVTVTGDAPSFGRTLARSVVKFMPWQLAHTAVFRLAAGSDSVTFLLLAMMAQLIVVASILMMIFDAQHRALHDLIAGTRIAGASPAPGTEPVRP